MRTQPTLFIILFITVKSYSQSFPLPKRYLCQFTEHALTIDGKASEKDWQKADWTDDFIDIEGDKKPKPLHRTRVKMLWDKEFFYVFAELEEPHLWATLTEDESTIYFDNDFEVFIDPNGDGHQYFEYEINAMGTQWDLYLDKPYRQKAKVFNSWNMKGLKKAVKLYGTLNQPNDIDKKWTVEIAIPWYSLMEGTDYNSKSNFPSINDQWKINFSRVQWQHTIKNNSYKKKRNLKTGKNLPEFNWVWSPQHTINMHQPEFWGNVQFVKSKNAKFISDPDEKIKLYLFELYKKQKNYFHNHKSFAFFEKLDISPLTLEKKQITPKIEFTSHFFEATIKSPFTKKSWLIDHEGRIQQIR